jgi:hypothetical protein
LIHVSIISEDMDAGEPQYVKLFNSLSQP